MPPNDAIGSGTNVTGNPFVAAGNKTALDSIGSAVTGAAGNLLGNAVGALGSVGGIATGIVNDVLGGGLDSVVGGVLMATKLDNLISGSSSFFGSGSPLRTTLNALGLRNASAAGASVEQKINDQQSKQSGGGDLVYPPDSAPYNMKFDFFEYKRASPLANTAVNKIGKSIILPLPESDIIDSTSASWQSQSGGPIGTALDNLKYANEIIQRYQAGGAKELLTGATDLTIYAADQLGSKFNLGEITTAAESQLGLVSNPSLSMIFNGIEFRQFQFSWKFSPKSEAESNTIKQIIHLFKQRHLPTFSGNDSTFLFNYPALCRPSFSLGQDFMTDFQLCVIKDVSVNYTSGGGGPAFYAKSKAPVFITLSLNMEEMEYRLPGSYSDQGQAANRGASALDVIKGQGSDVAQGINSISNTLGGGNIF